MAVRSGKSDVIVKLEEEDAALSSSPQSPQISSNYLRIHGDSNNSPFSRGRGLSFAVRNRSNTRSTQQESKRKRLPSVYFRAPVVQQQVREYERITWWKTCKTKTRRYLERKREKARHRNVVQGAVFSLMTSSLYKMVLTLTVLLHAAIMCLYQPETKGDVHPINRTIYYLTIGFWLFYCLEAVLNMIAYGLIIRSKHAYLRQPLFILDLVVILLGFIYLTFYSYIPVVAEICSALMALKLIRIFAFSETVQSILNSLARSIFPLYNLFLLTVLVLVFFALMGIEIFQGRLHGGCYSNYTTPAGNTISVLVSQFPCNLNDDLGSLVVGAHACPYNSVCKYWELGPKFGIVSFDDVFRGILIVFQLITLEGWSAVLFLYESSVGYGFCWIYFLVVTQLGSVFILNLLTGVLTNIFKGFSERSLQERKRREKMREDQLEGYDQITKNHQRQIAERRSRFHSFLKKTWAFVVSLFDSFLENWEKLQSPNCLASFHQGVKQLLRSDIWLWVNIIAHLVNLILLMCIIFPSPTAVIRGISIANSLFSVYFILEVLVRLYGKGPANFFKHKDKLQLLANYAEATLAILSVGFLIVYYLDSDLNILVIANAIWSVKVVMACKPFNKSWKHLKEVLDTLGKLMKPIIGLGALVLLFLFIFTNIGIRIFGTRLHLNTNNVQPNFDDFANSFFLVFQLLTTEDWHNTLYSSTGSIIFKDGELAGIFSSIYFVIGLLLGFFVLVTVFLALAVDELSEVEFATSDDEEDEENKQNDMKEEKSSEAVAAVDRPKTMPLSFAINISSEEGRKIPTHSKSAFDLEPPANVLMSKGVTKHFNKGLKRNLSASGVESSAADISSPDDVNNQRSSYRDNESISSGASTPNFQERYIRSSSLEDFSEKPLDSTFTTDESYDKPSIQKRIQRAVKLVLNEMYNYFGTFIWDPSKELEEIPAHSSFFIINPQSRFRKACFAIVKSRTFQTITIASIFLSSVLLTVEVPIGVPTSNQLCSFQRVAIYLDIIFVAFFSVEMLLKMISLGVIFHRGSYFRGVFNIMDFLVTVFNLIPIIVYLINWDQRILNICISYGYDISALPGSIGALRVVRVFRPLRAIRIKGLYLVVTGMITSIKAMASVFFLDLIVLLIFSVVGVYFFKGSFYGCTDSSIEIEENCRGEYLEYDYTFFSNISNISIPGITCPVTEAREWSTIGLNFDHVGNAFVSLFVMLTSEGWQNVMYSGVNSRRPLNSFTPLAQMIDANRGAALYYILYMIFMTFILIQLLVGFVIVTFQQVGIKPYRETKLDRNQRSCLQIAITARPKLKWTPKNKTLRAVREKLLPLVQSNMARAVVGLALAANVICLCLQIYKYKTLIVVIYYVNTGFTMFFAVEALVKMTILSPKVYFHSAWNTCEFIIAAGSALEFVLQNSLPSPILPHSHFVSTLRTLILLRFIPEVRRILRTVIRAFKIFPWVGYLMGIVVFIYAVVGMHIFGTIQPMTVDQSDETGIHEYNNYANFPSALLLIIRVSTGENWQDVMLDSRSGQLCNNCTGLFKDDTVRCGSDIAIPFYITFYCISVILILNLFVSIIIDHFEYVTTDKSQLTDYDLRKFFIAWQKYDPQATGLLPVEEVFQMMHNLEPPVGWGAHCPDQVAYRKMMHLGISIIEVEEQVKNGEVEKVQKVSFNSTLMAVVRYAMNIDCGGCPRCQITCNQILKDKLKKCFPDMKMESYSSLFATESDETVAQLYAARLLQRHWLNLKRRRRQKALIGDDNTNMIPKPVGALNPDKPSDELCHRQHTMKLEEKPQKCRKTSTDSATSVSITVQNPDGSFTKPESPGLSTSFQISARHLSFGAQGGRPVLSQENENEELLSNNDTSEDNLLVESGVNESNC